MTLKKCAGKWSVVLALCVSVVVGTGQAFAFNWETSVGQGGGSLTMNLYVDPNDDQNLYASGDFHSGLWKSTNTGTTWRQINKGLRAMWVWSVAVTPGNSNIVYAATRMGPHKSTNGGLTWEMKRNGFPALNAAGNGNASPINGIFVDPRNGNTVYACVAKSSASDRFFGRGADDASTYGIWKSTDAGENWGKLSSFPAIPAVEMAFDATNPNIMWAGAVGDSTNVNNGGVFKSTDAGASWTRLCNGLPNHNSKTGPMIYRILPHPTNTNIVYAVRSGGQQADPCVYWSTNGGTSWAVRSNGIENGTRVVYPWRALAMSPTNPNIMYFNAHYAGIFKSTDAGANWVRKTEGNDPGDNALSYNHGPSGDNRPWLDEIGTDYPGSIWWASMNVAVGKQRGIVFTTSLAAIHRSYNEGETWTTPSTRAMSNPDNGYYRSTGYATYYIKSISFDPKDPKYVFCTNWDSERLHKSEDGGLHWRFSMRGCIDEHMSSAQADVAVDPDDGRVVYYAENGNSVGSFYRSTNHGTTWQERRPTGAKNCHQICIAKGGTVDARTIYVVAGTGGLYRTTNSGSTWYQFPTTLGISLLAVDPQNPSVMYAEGTGGLIKTTDAGANWENINRGVLTGGIEAIAINPYNTQNVLVGGFVPGHLYRTTNAGTTWEISWELPHKQAHRVNAVVFDPHDLSGKTVFVSTLYFGGHYDNDDIPGNPYMSTDGGSTFTPVGDGLDQYHISVLAISPHERTLWVGTWGSGMARVSIPHLLGQAPNWKGKLDSLNALESPSAVEQPAPSRKSAVGYAVTPKLLRIAVGAQSQVLVFNVAGRRIINRHFETAQSAVLDIKAYPAGVYVVKVVDNNGSVSHRFTKVR